jgi:predicted dehydrogenase
MKTFKDLQFNPHPNKMGGVQAIERFENGYGASVVCTPYTYGGKEGLYELAVFGSDGSITYDTPITNDVLGYLSEQDVTEVLIKIQQL